MSHVPGWWAFTLLALGAYRLVRLAGWDTFPPVERARARLTREGVEPVCSACDAGRDDYEHGPGGWGGLDECPNCGSPGQPDFVPYHGRPLLADLLACPFCIGAWLSLAAYAAWILAPGVALVVATPLALSAVVGLVSKNLDG